MIILRQTSEGCISLWSVLHVAEHTLKHPHQSRNIKYLAPMFMTKAWVAEGKMKTCTYTYKLVINQNKGMVRFQLLLILCVGGVLKKFFSPLAKCNKIKQDRTEHPRKKNCNICTRYKDMRKPKGVTSKFY